MDKQIIAQELIVVAKMLVATSVRMREVDENLVVTGSYSDMKDVFPKLKTLGFRYNGNDRSWWISSAKLTAEKRKKVEGLISGKEKDSGDLIKKVEETLDKLLSTYKSSNFKVTKNTGKLYVSGSTFDIKDAIMGFGGRWDGGSRLYEFSLSGMAEDTPDKIFDLLKKQDEELNQRLEKRRAFFKTHIQDKKWAGDQIFVDLRNDVMYVHTDKQNNDVVKNSFSYVKWTGLTWEVPLSRTGTKEMDKFVKLAEEAKATPVQQSSAPILYSVGSGYLHTRGLSYGEGDVIVAPASVQKEHGEQFIKVLKIKSQYFREDGLSFGVGDDQGYIWTISARPATDVESNSVKIEIARKEGRAEARKELLEIAKEIQSKGERPPKWQEPSGDVFYLNDSAIMYGGGDWLVVGNDGIWYVRNNGADGDDWSDNNVHTGGAGGIGWKMRHTDALDDKIRILVEVVGLKRG